MRIPLESKISVKYNKWHEFFAIRPRIITLKDGRVGFVFLERLKRKRIEGDYASFGEDFWVYKLINK
jgi:hypothetical protein